MLSYAAILRASLELVSTAERVHYLSVLSRHDHQRADGLGLHLMTDAYHNALCGLYKPTGISLYVARIPALYYAYPNMSKNGSALANYNNAILIIILSVVPIYLMATYWSIAYMYAL